MGRGGRERGGGGHNPISKQSINFDGGEGGRGKEEEVDSLHTVFLELYLQLIAYPCLFMYAFIRSIFFTCT